jgi:hypothetical protein
MQSTSPPASDQLVRTSGSRGRLPSCRGRAHDSDHTLFRRRVSGQTEWPVGLYMACSSLTFCKLLAFDYFLRDEAGCEKKRGDG